MSKALLKIFISLSFFSFLFAFFRFPLSFANTGISIKILLVPGHDNEIWGAEYGNIKEADMNLALATRIFNILKKDKRFEVWITRDNLGYTKEFADYFSSHRQDIISFEKNSKNKLQNKIKEGSFIREIKIKHNKATEDTAVRLYGINKWADENKIDAVIHIHFNDYPRKGKWVKGVYKGFAIYLPEKQMINSEKSAKLAKSVFSQLSKKYTSSNYKQELNGLVPDQNLIALGSNGTLSENIRSILIEYGYIYRFENNIMRRKAYSNMANLTIAGIENYFFEK